MMRLSEEEVLELTAVSFKPEFTAAFEALREVFHRVFLVSKGGETVIDLTQVQPHAQQLLSHPAVVKVLAWKERSILDEIVALPWDGSDANLTLVGEQLSNLEALDWVMGLAGHRPMALQLVGEQKVSVVGMVRLYRAFGAIHRNVVMIREQKRLQDVAGTSPSDLADERRNEVH